MNRAVNNIIFVVAATVFIILLIICIFFILFIPFALFMPRGNDALGVIVMTVIFLLSMGGSFFIYNKVMKILIKRFDIEKYIGSNKK